MTEFAPFPMDLPDSILVRLRRETADQHQALESVLDLLNPDLTVRQYGRVLQLFHGAFGAWERALDQHCPAACRELWEGRRKVHRLLADLKTLGLAPDPALQGRVTPPAVNAGGLWIGSLYVMEGSTLGGQLLSRHFESHFGWTGGEGYSFFNPYGSRTGEQWRAVCGEIAASPWPSNQIVAGAHQTFDYLYRCFLVPE